MVWKCASKNVLNLSRLQQNNKIRLCLRKDNLIGSTYSKYKQFNVLPLELLLKKKKNAVMFEYKKSNFFFTKQNDKPMSGDRLFN